MNRTVIAMGTVAALSLTGVMAALGTADVMAAPTKMVLQIHEIKCWDETTGKYREKFGVDTMRLAAISIDPTGVVTRTPVMKLGDFAKDGVLKAFTPPRVLASFPVRTTLKFPIQYQAVLVLAEKDQLGGFEKGLDAMAKQGRDAALAKAKSLGATAVEAVPEVVASGNVSWETFAAAIGRKLLTKQMGIWLGDDVFPPQLQSLRVPTKNFTFPGGKAEGSRTKVIFTGNQGKYHVIYSWKLM